MLYNFKLAEFMDGHIIANYEARAVLLFVGKIWGLDCIEILTPAGNWVKLALRHRLHELAVNILHDERREIDKAWGEYLARQEAA